MQKRISAALKNLDKKNEAWNGNGDAPREWWLAVDEAISSIAENPAAIALDEIHLCEPTAEAINGYLAGLGATDKETGEPITAPHRKLLSGLGRMLQAVPHAWPPLESVDVLNKQGVPHEQIERMHGLRRGDAEMILLGKMKYPANHVTPHVLDQRETQKRARNILRMAAAKWNAQKAIEASMEDDDRELSAAEMLANGSTVGEVAEHFDVDEDLVIDEIEGTNLDVDNGDDEALEDNILAAHADGQTNVDIADMLGVSVQRVAAVVRIAAKYGAMRQANSTPATANNSTTTGRKRGRPPKSEADKAESAKLDPAKARQKIARVKRSAAAN